MHAHDAGRGYRGTAGTGVASEIELHKSVRTCEGHGGSSK